MDRCPNRFPLGTVDTAAEEAPFYEQRQAEFHEAEEVIDKS